MDDARFLEAVRSSSGLSDDEDAARTVDAVLRRFAEAITGGAAERLAQTLPPVAATSLREPGGDQRREGRPARPTALEDLITAVRERQSVERTQAADRVQAVLRAVAYAADRAAVDAARAQLAGEIAALLAAVEEERPTTTRVS